MKKYKNITNEPPKLDVVLPSMSNTCAVVAVSLLLKMPFDSAYEELMFEGYIQRRLMNTRSVIVNTINKNSMDDRQYYMTSKITSKKKKYGNCETVGEFIDYMGDNSYIILVPYHCFYVSNRCVYDGIRKRSGIFVKFERDVFEKKVLELKRFWAILPKGDIKNEKCI